MDRVLLWIIQKLAGNRMVVLNAKLDGTVWSSAAIWQEDGNGVLSPTHPECKGVVAACTFIAPQSATRWKDSDAMKYKALFGSSGD